MFQVGQKVVCVDAAWVSPRAPGQENRPRERGVYTVRQVYVEKFAKDPEPTTALLLAEVRNSKQYWKTFGYHEAGFAARRFRPLTERKENLEARNRLFREWEKTTPATRVPENEQA